MISKKKYQDVSRLNVNNADKTRTPDYIRMYFRPLKSASNPLDLRFTLAKPFVRNYPAQVLQMATPVSFNDISDSQSFDNEANILESSSQPQAGLLLANSEMLKYSMEQEFNGPRNQFVDGHARNLVGSYIYEKFARYGLVVTTQDFLQTRAIEDLLDKSVDFRMDAGQINGTNIFGILPGKYWNSIKDRPLIIGAHWDTVENSQGFNDNGSGVSALLEMGRILASSCLDFSPDFTLIFIAFGAEEEGAIGAQEFINKYIVPSYLRRGIQIQGAIILDTIFNYDSLPGSQTIPQQWKQLVPDTHERLLKNGQRGDFMAMILRDHPQELQMKQTIEKWSARGVKIEPFVLKQFPAYHEASISVLQDHSYFWTSDHARFWHHKEGKQFFSFPSILITDTGR